MSPTTYLCAEDLRAEAVRDSSLVNGIDFVEVLGDQTTLALHFLHALPGEADGLPTTGKRLNRTHVLVEGGDRVRGIRVVSTSTAGDVLTVTVSAPGDFSTYRLRLLDPVTQQTPAGFDPRLAVVDFSFKAGCPIRFDCAPREAAPSLPPTSSARDYLAKDYDSFRRLMLDRLTTSMPGWTERNPADGYVALVELLAFVADRLSYQQDSVAMESYLGTARRRVSVRRHARLLGYRMHEGCAARSVVHLSVLGASAVTVETGRQFLTGPDGDPDTVVFESLGPVTAHPDHNRIDFYTWSDAQCHLPAGATRATVLDSFTPALSAGDLLLLEEVADGGAGGEVADRSHRHVVRLTDVTPAVDPLDGTAVVELAWSPADALPFPLRISARTTTGGPVQRRVCGVARGNLVLVEHGASVPTPVLLEDGPDVAGRWRPRLPDGRPTWAVPFIDPHLAASALLDLDPRAALPQVRVVDAEGTGYDAVLDLMASLPEDAHVVVETQEDGGTTLRFGDGTYGRRPEPARAHRATYRTGHGTVGNVGAEAIRHMRPADPDLDVANPVPARGGADPEPTEQVRVGAPQAFRGQERAVTEADYGDLLPERLPGVQRAVGRLRWSGLYSAFVSVDREGGAVVDAAFRERVLELLDRYRMAGVDVEVRPPTVVPLEIDLAVCARDRFASDVERDVLDVLSARDLPDGSRGAFHPDALTFGTPVYLSAVYAAVLGVPGVQTVRATTFRRYGRAAQGELQAGVLRVSDLEVAQLANDPDVPERGVLTVTVAGGR